MHIAAQVCQSSLCSVYIYAIIFRCKIFSWLLQISTILPAEALLKTKARLMVHVLVVCQAYAEVCHCFFNIFFFFFTCEEKK